MTPQQLLTPRILWASLLMSNVFLVVVIFLISGADAIVWSRALPALPALSLDAESLPSMLQALCVAPLVASFVVPRLVVQQARSSTLPVLQRALTPFILTMALAEACTVFGFAAAHVAQVPELVLLPAAATIAVGLLRFPTTSSFERLAGLKQG